MSHAYYSNPTPDYNVLDQLENTKVPSNEPEARNPYHDDGSYNYSGYPAISDQGPTNGLNSSITEDKIKSILSVYGDNRPGSSSSISHSAEQSPSNVVDIFGSQPQKSDVPVSGNMVSSPSHQGSTNSNQFQPTHAPTQNVHQIPPAHGNAYQSYPVSNNPYQQTQDIQPPQQQFQQMSVSGSSTSGYLSSPPVNQTQTHQPVSQNKPQQQPVQQPPQTQTQPQQQQQQQQPQSQSQPQQHQQIPNPNLAAQSQQAILQQMQQQQAQFTSIIQHQFAQHQRDMAQQMGTYFTRIMQFMDNIDQRMNSLEHISRRILKDQQDNQSVPISTFELETAKKAQEQLETDAEIAKRLQAEIDGEAEATRRKNSFSSSTSNAYNPSVSKPQPGLQDCPICHVRMTVTELEAHIEPCLDKESKKDGPKKAELQDKQGFLTRFFGKNPSGDPSKNPKPNVMANKPVDPKLAQSQQPPAYNPAQFGQPQQQYMYSRTGATGYPGQPGQPGGQPYMMVNPTTGQMSPMMYYYNPNQPGYSGQK